MEVTALAQRTCAGCARLKVEEETLRTNDIDTHLEEQLDSLDGGHSSFGDGSGGTTSQEVLGEGNGCVTHLRMLSDSSARWGLPVELKWPTPTWRRADLKGPAARKTVNSDSHFRLAVRTGGWAVLVDALRVREGPPPPPLQTPPPLVTTFMIASRD